jgi:hypothetical protein
MNQEKCFNTYDVLAAHSQQRRTDGCFIGQHNAVRFAVDFEPR